MKKLIPSTMLALGLVLPCSAFATADKTREIPVSLTEKGFEPSEIKIKKGEKAALLITRKTEDTCAQKVAFAGNKTYTDLPLNKAVRLAVPSDKSGAVKFGCSMDMMVGGTIVVE